MAAKPQQGPIFIGGAGRSGTTLLRMMLDSHPNICCGPELKILPDISRCLGLLLGPLRGVMEGYGNTPDQVRHHFCRLVEGLVENFLQASGKTRWAEKTPHNVLSMAALRNLFPEARFLHVIRDGRDVACSLVTMQWADPNTGRKVDYIQNIAKAARYWRQIVEAGRKQAASPNLAGRVLEVRYETLVLETEETLQKVLAFLEEPWHPGVLSYDGASHSPFPEPDESSTHQARKPVYHSSIGRWKTEMTEADRAAFKHEAGQLLVTLGYTDPDW